MKRIWLFRIVVAMFGPALLVGLELLLRSWSTLAPPPLLITIARWEDKILRNVNALYARRFFFRRYQGRLITSSRMANHPFVEPAPVKPYRIIFVGDSTVQGFPHPSRLAAAAFLEAMLQDVWPRKQVQVFNLGITSIASFAVARTLEDAMALEPDLVVVYSGHNEFYGIYGVGNQATPLYNQLHYAILQLRTAQLLRWGLDFFMSSEIASASLLKIMAESGQVPVDSPRRPAALLHLRASLLEMCEVCHQHDIPLIFCTLVANDAGFAPAASTPPPLTGQEEIQWQTWVEQAAASVTGNEVTRSGAIEAVVALDKAAVLSAEHAWLWYLRGRALACLGRGKEAFDAFRRARDLDTMPWRAPSDHNKVIREVAAETGALVADVEAAFVQAALPEGIGWELIDDHVHPSIEGQILLARTILHTLKSLTANDPMELDRLRGDSEYRVMLGDLPVEQGRVKLLMARLLSEPPMERYNTHNARFLKKLAAEGWQNLSGPEQRGSRKWTRHMDEVSLALDVADQLFMARDFAGAKLHYAASRREAPYTPRGDLWATVQWCWSIKMLGEAFSPAQREMLKTTIERAEFLLQVAGIDPSFIDFVKGELYYFLGEHEQALDLLEHAFLDADFRRQFPLHTLFLALASELVHAGRLEDARRYADVASAESDQSPYFLQVVEMLSRGDITGLPPLSGEASTGFDLPTLPGRGWSQTLDPLR